MTQPPLLLIVDNDRGDHALANMALAGSGWQLAHVYDAAGAVASAQNRRYALILMGVRMPGLDGFATTKSIRRGGGASALAPILASCAPRQIASPTALRTAGMDGHVAKPFAPEALREAVESWRPRNASTQIARLAAIFGTAGIAHLLDGFRDLLENQLGLDDGAARYAGAHRLAGIAGTLGFPDLSRLWLAVSEGDDTAYAEARINARKALVEIDANPISAERSRGPSTSR